MFATTAHTAEDLARQTRLRRRLQTSWRIGITSLLFIAVIALAWPLTWRGSFSRAQTNERPAQLNGFAQQARLTANDGAGSDHFGQAVALSGDTALVGMPGDNVGLLANQGSAYVFRRSSGTWSQEQQLLAPDGLGGDSFGLAVAVAGDLAVIGAPFDDTPTGFNAGSVYVFRRTGVTWTFEQQIMPSDPQANDWFGSAVAVNGDTILVGAPMKAVGAQTTRGAAYVFRRVASTWTQEQQLLASDGAMSDEFGGAVALQANTALVGASGKNGAQGAAYVFTRSGVVWSEQQKLTDGSLQADDRFGKAVALHNDTALIGAPQGLSSHQGTAFVFTRSGVVWSSQGQLNANDGASNDGFGSAVALYADTALVGAPLDDLGPGDASLDQGSAYVFLRTGSSWLQQEKLTAIDGAADDQAGLAVSLDSQAAVLGAWLKDITNFDQGAAYVFNAGCPNITIQPATLPPGLPNTFYNETLSATGGVAPYGFAITAGALPSGLTLNAAGNLSGTTTQMGAFGFTVRVTDVNGCFTSRAYTLMIGNCPTITFNPLVLAPTAINAVYVQPLIAQGGVSPHNFTVIAGTLPAGLELSLGGVLNGTPTVYGTSTFTVQATDASGCSSTRNYSLTITCPVITLAPATLPQAVIGAAYNLPLAAQGGVAPYVYSLIGLLPSGLSLTSAGVITGTPASVGVFNIGVKAIDASGCTVIYPYSLTVCNAITISPATLANGTLNQLYPTVNFSAAGGLAPYALTLNGVLPSGMTFAQNALSGTPTQAGSFGFVVQAVDASGCVHAQNYNLTIVIDPCALGGCGTLTAMPNPIQVCDNTGLGITTLSWSAPAGLQTQVRVGASNGTLFTSGGATGSATTGKWVTNAMQFFLVNAANGIALASTTVALTDAGCGGGGTLTLTPNPLQVCDGTGLGVATVSWNAPGIAATQVRVGSANGTLFTSGGASGSAMTGKWVSNGLTFFLINTANGATLATVTASVNATGCGLLTATPRQIQVCDGSGLGITTLSWNAPGVAVTQIRVGSPTGPLFTGGGATGLATTGKWVSNGMQFFLVNAANGATLANTTVNVSTTGCTSPGGTITATPNAIQVCDGTGLGVTTIQWNAPGVTATQVRVGSPAGVLFTAGGSTGSANTGKWVTSGMQFFLINSSNGAPIGSVTASVTTTGCF